MENEAHEKLSQQDFCTKHFEKMGVGGRLPVSLNGVNGHAMLFCVERTENPTTLSFRLQIHGVMTRELGLTKQKDGKWQTR